MPQEFSRLARWIAVAGGCTLLAACGGGGGSDDGIGGGGGGGGGVTSIVISGRITFDRLEFNASNTGLNAANPVVSPARDVVVEVMGSSTRTTTDNNGNYSLTAPANTAVTIQARAQMEKTGSAPTWNFTVLNNANSNAVYLLRGQSVTTGTANETRDLHAPSGWGTTGYTGTRAAAPFAILDTVYRAKQLIIGASTAAVFNPLNLYWSSSNSTADSPFCPAIGNIGTSFYYSGTDNDECTTSRPLPNGIYILGKFENNGDTDEFDAHVIAHEFGHYFEDNFSRSDSIGGQHSAGNLLDLRVAFGEGWGNGFSGMTQNDPVYRDSQGGISGGFSFNLESGLVAVDGWFSEPSVGEFLWDVFDSNTPPEAGDNVALGFNPIFAVMSGPQRDTDALTSIFSFASALRAANGSSTQGINDLLSGKDINGTGAFGAGETNDGGDVGFGGVYRDISTAAPVTGICSTSSAGGNVDGNKLGNRQFLRFVKNTSGLVTIQADGVAAVGVPGSGPAEDPDILVYQRGVLKFASESTAVRQEQLSQVQLEAGTYVLEVYAYEVIGAEPPARVSTPRCVMLSITGTN